MRLHWSMCFGWDLKAGKAESWVASSGRAEWKGWGPHSHTVCFIPPSLQPNRIICCFSVSLKTLCLWMWYSPCFNPDSFSSQFLLVYYAWIDFTSSRKPSCMPLLDDVLVVILPQTLGVPLSWHLPCSSVIIGFLVFLLFHRFHCVSTVSIKCSPHVCGIELIQWLNFNKVEHSSKQRHHAY